MANVSTVNPNNPVQGSALLSRIVRNNFQATANDINYIFSLIGNGGGFTSENKILSGLTAPTALFQSVNLWNSATSGAKTQPIPTATGSLTMLMVGDVYGNCGTSGQEVTIVPLTGSIIGNNQLYTNNMIAWYLDTTLGWLSV